MNRPARFGRIVRRAVTVEPPSSSGLGHRPFKAAARVRIPLGALSAAAGNAWSCRAARSARHPVKVEVAGSNPVRTAGDAHQRPSKMAQSHGQVAQLVRASA